ncbi:hypothetical protein C8R43DRAFT_1102099 [Mycena crocata]|nr:hypothetical protein C8R43DRAFT_1102099 [Mycena crocata]
MYPRPESQNTMVGSQRASAASNRTATAASMRVSAAPQVPVYGINRFRLIRFSPRLPGRIQSASVRLFPGVWYLLPPCCVVGIIDCNHVQQYDGTPGNVCPNFCNNLDDAAGRRWKYAIDSLGPDPRAVYIVQAGVPPPPQCGPSNFRGKCGVTLPEMGGARLGHDVTPDVQPAFPQRAGAAATDIPAHGAQHHRSGRPAISTISP